MLHKHYYVYFARCADDTIYTGYTTDLAQREKQHNAGKGARYTQGRRPVKFIYHEKHKTLSAALRREYKLKKLSREEKENIIANCVKSRLSIG